ncbi:hypothetical protein, partial [Serratia marcescens]
VERVEALGLLEPVGRLGREVRWRDFTGRRLAHAEIGMLGRPIVEVIAWTVGCHGTDGTDRTCQPADANP